MITRANKGSLRIFRNTTMGIIYMTQKHKMKKTLVKRHHNCCLLQLSLLFLTVVLERCCVKQRTTMSLKWKIFNKKYRSCLCFCSTVVLEMCCIKQRTTMSLQWEIFNNKISQLSLLLFNCRTYSCFVGTKDTTYTSLMFQLVEKPKTKNSDLTHYI